MYWPGLICVDTLRRIHNVGLIFNRWWKMDEALLIIGKPKDLWLSQGSNHETQINTHCNYCLTYHCLNLVHLDDFINESVHARRNKMAFLNRIGSDISVQSYQNLDKLTKISNKLV